MVSKKNNRQIVPDDDSSSSSMATATQPIMRLGNLRGGWRVVGVNRLSASLTPHLARTVHLKIKRQLEELT
jgi:hypothetical protein